MSAEIDWTHLHDLHRDGVSPWAIGEIARRHNLDPDLERTADEQPRLDGGEPVYAQTWREIREARVEKEGLLSEDAATWHRTFTLVQDERWAALVERFERDMDWDALLAYGLAQQ